MVLPILRDAALRAAPQDEAGFDPSEPEALGSEDHEKTSDYPFTAPAVRPEDMYLRKA